MFTHLVVVPKMLEREKKQAKTTEKGKKRSRSAILTLKSKSEFLFEKTSSRKNILQFPILQSAMAFSTSLSESLGKAYQDQGIDFMHAHAPFLAFESAFQYGLILQVLWNERLLKKHVSTVLSDMIQGSSSSTGGIKYGKQMFSANDFRSLSYFYDPMFSGQSNTSFLPIEQSQIIKYLESIDQNMTVRPSKTVEVDSKQV